MQIRFYCILILAVFHWSVVFAQDKAPTPLTSTAEVSPKSTSADDGSASVGKVAKLTIRTTVITNDLAVKVVPRLALSIEPQTGTPIQVSSSLEGSAIVELAPGTYRVKSTRGLDFESKHFDWDVRIEVKTGDN
jgi:hypothetical protein